MLEMNLDTQINNVNYLVYMEYKYNESGAKKELFEGVRTTIEEEQKEKEK